MRARDLETALCAAFCDGLQVHPVAAGFAVSAAFEASSGDRLSFYVVPTCDGWVVEDDGSYLAELVAKDVDIDRGQRAQMLDAILGEAQAAWDRDTYEIRTGAMGEEAIGTAAVRFLAALIRIRSLETLTREAIRTTFREDAIAALKRAIGDEVEVEEGGAVTADLRDFPADLILRPKHPEAAKPAAVYLVSNNDRLNEALLLKLEQERTGRRDFEVIALVEDLEATGVSRRKFQRAQNRDLAMPIFRSDEDAAMAFIANRVRGRGHAA